MRGSTIEPAGHASSLPLYFRLLDLARYATMLVGFGGYVHWYVAAHDPRFLPVAGLFVLLLALNAALHRIVPRPRGPLVFVTGQVFLTAMIALVSPPGTGWFVYVYFVTLSVTVMLLEGAAAIMGGLGVAGLALAQFFSHAGMKGTGIDGAGIIAAFIFVFGSSLMSKMQLQGWMRERGVDTGAGVIAGVAQAIQQGTAASPAVLDGLTPRETEILCLVAEGLSNQEIAARLYLSEGTVKNHISNIYGKLHLRDRAQAAIYAIEHGLVPPRRSQDSLQG